MKMIVRRRSAEKSVMATRHPQLRREIALMLAIKVALLYGLWFLFFSEPQLKKMTEGMDPDKVAASIVSPNPTTQTPNP